MNGNSKRRKRCSTEDPPNHIEEQETNVGQFQKTVDLDKIPASVISGLKKGDGNAALLHSEDLENEETEVWILQCTKNVDLAQLIEGKKIILDNEQPTLLRGVDQSGREFESMCVPLDNEQGGNIATLLPDQDGNVKLVSSPLSGYIMLRESIQELPPPFFNISPPYFHQLPSGLKHRHPVYGVNVAELLCKLEPDSDPELFLKKSKKRKKEKRRREIETEDVPNTQNGIDSESECVRTKKRKRIHVEVETEVDYTPDTPRKSKKHKSGKRRSEIELIPEEIPICLDSESEIPPRTKSKKHKKAKIEIETESELSPKKSKKHKRNK